ncbi:hypothetical protein OFB62_32265, partial [Escherichia coli]|nr:hypothetical protein [Escherichia coli]
TPILGLLPLLENRETALRPPGPITPITSIPNFCRIFGKANAEAVLQATTKSFIPCEAKNIEFSRA